MRWTNRSGFNDEVVSDDFRILVVDDDRDCIELMKLLFKMEGFRITSASSADEALALLKRSRFSLMLTDYNMPGKDGLMLSEEARETAPELIIIMAIGNSSDHLKYRASKLGIKAVMTKPINFSELFGMIRIEKRQRITHITQADRGPVQAVTGYRR